jgi:hypothetical protein
MPETEAAIGFGPFHARVLEGVAKSQFPLRQWFSKVANRILIRFQKNDPRERSGVVAQHGAAFLPNKAGDYPSQVAVKAKHLDCKVYHQPLEWEQIVFSSPFICTTGRRNPTAFNSNQGEI